MFKENMKCVDYRYNGVNGQVYITSIHILTEDSHCWSTVGAV